jgi:hypothetical protein
VRQIIELDPEITLRLRSENFVELAQAPSDRM